MAEDVHGIPDERPQRRREYSGAGSTLGVAALIIVAVGVALWWFELRGGDSATVDTHGYGIQELPAALNTTGKAPAAEAGRAAPNFRLQRLDGGEAALTDFRGQFVLVNFWASWCGPCRGEAPDLQALADRHPGKVAVLGVNQQESRDAAQKFADEFDLRYPIVLDSAGEVSAGYRVGSGLPVTVLVGPDGVVRHEWLGRVTAQDIAAFEQEYLP